jgi:hypothetical protein
MTFRKVVDELLDHGYGREQCLFIPYLSFGNLVAQLEHNRRRIHKGWLPTRFRRFKHLGVRKDFGQITCGERTKLPFLPFFQEFFKLGTAFSELLKE